jgi:phenylalanyl-tRNA synthetase beta chain
MICGSWNSSDGEPTRDQGDRVKVLLSWLKDYIDIPSTVDELAERLPMLGLGHERVERFGDDAVFDLELPANRGDLMCHVGVAREIAAATRSVVRFPAADPRPDRAAASGGVRVEVRESQLCPRFTAALISDVHVGPSPDWMARRLEACGIRSINNVVDVTNYVMLEWGQPMHAYDYDLVQGARLIVRLAAAGERLTTLDGVDRVLDPQILVVADAVRVVGIGGVIGGANTEIRAATRRVLLEAASWHPPMIRRTSKRLGVRTESSARFERGVDTSALPAVASARAQQLMVEVASGRIESEPLDAYPSPHVGRQLELHWPSVARLLGVAVPQAEGVAILRSLGFAVAGPRNVLTVSVPSFRGDVEREEDLIEEVARHYGYDRIPETMPLEATAQGSRLPILDAERTVREVLIRTGLTEALTVSLTTPAALDGLRLSLDHPWRSMVRLRNPMVEDHTHLRTTLVPGLLQVARGNISRRVTDVCVFELGRTFHSSSASVRERRRLTILMTGRILRGAWNVPPEASMASFFHLKGILESLFEELRITGTIITAAPATWLHPGKAAAAAVNEDAVGVLGELHPDVAAAYELPPGVYVADVDVEVLLERAVFRPQFVTLPRFPSVRRDVAAVVPQTVPAADVERVIAEAGGGLLASVELFDVYTGPPVPAGHRNLAYTLSFRSSERTLTAEEVDAVVRRITDVLTRRLRLKIRQ